MPHALAVYTSPLAGALAGRALHAGAPLATRCGLNVRAALFVEMSKACRDGRDRGRWIHVDRCTPTPATFGVVSFGAHTRESRS
jgi:hypothetical protein